MPAREPRAKWLTETADAVFAGIKGAMTAPPTAGGREL
jgi:hypothetical protein